MSNFKEHEETAIKAFVRAFSALTPTLNEAAAMRWEATPGSSAARGAGPDPTADVVLDPTRLALDRAIHAATLSLQASANTLNLHVSALEATLEAYRN